MKCVTAVIGTPTTSDEYEEEYTEEYPSYNFFKFRPQIWECYEIHDQSEKVTSLTCQKPIDPAKFSCINLVVGEQYCLELKTPTNESVQFLCKDSEEELFSYYSDDEVDNCYNVSRPDQSYRKVCHQKFDSYSIGITTPDNFTILLDSEFCSTSMNNEEIETYDHFIRTFSFDPKPRRCYKIYEELQYVSPYTCLSEEVFTACVKELPHVRNCEGIITQNNETIILQCTDDRESSESRNCFDIYTADNNFHIACQKKVEERCVGITTPSNLTLLLECYYCVKPGL